MSEPQTRSRRPLASLSIDVDNKWAYLRAAGRENWESCDSYLPMALRRVTDILGELRLPLTAFVVGRDLESEEDVEAIDSLRQLGDCELANHSLNHLPWMHTMDPAEIECEIVTTHDRLLSALDAEAVGFRGPGFSCPPEVLDVLLRHGYRYDASIFPTSIAPIARAVFLARAKLKGEQKEKAKKLYGGFASMRNPNRPFVRSVASESIWEIPVTVMPWLRTPIHFSYFTFLASFSTAVAKSYLRTAFRLCRSTGTPPSLLLHPPDFMGREDDQDMAYFPGMKTARADKLELVRWALALYAETFEVCTMRNQIERLDESSANPSPHFSNRRER
ncbi:polysaccharide deacetylase family protein [Rhodopirellula sp. MGV]|uniref:polysaccharide deacetylase family protein n=1 Tax=Rhodopirellula sp. MGV TaxID=2023130 RepID=UPI000B96D269|nr:polysaccharide deacetylase family protein [Rhodopirellula sp. MGV]OYP37013.1 chitooligosaccharide deacetylase [Rhodopirellula sp. MGV]PNY36295.1 chitooligosaccharide deacetylase [Rhodopirellula baltica]